MLDKRIVDIQKHYGKLINRPSVEEGVEVTGIFANEEKEIENSTIFNLEKLKGKKNKKSFMGKTVGDAIVLKTKGLFNEDHDLMYNLGVDQDEAHDLDIEVTFTIEEINKYELAELDQELFDKAVGADKVHSVTQLREFIKEEAEQQFLFQSDQKLLNDITESLIENTKFDLPSEFLKKWIQNTGEEPLTEDKAVEEYERSEKGLRYQLIESKIREEYNLNISFDEVKTKAMQTIKEQMAQYGRLNPEEKELEDIAARVLANEEEVKRITEQVWNKKLLNFFKENAHIKTKEITFEDFIKTAYGD